MERHNAFVPYFITFSLQGIMHNFEKIGPSHASLVSQPYLGQSMYKQLGSNRVKL